MVQVFIGVLAGVLLHEAGHLLAARWRGVAVHRFRLTVLGGHVELSESHPIDTLIIALVGPLVNIGVAVLALFVSPVWAAINVALFAVNMLPLYPLDGATVVRAILTMITSYKFARRATLLLSTTLSLVMIGIGAVWPTLRLLLMGGGLFLLWRTFTAWRDERRRRALRELTVAAIPALIRHTIQPSTLAKRITPPAAVSVDGKVLGVVTKTHTAQRATHVMEAVPEVEITDSLLMALTLMERANQGVAAVYDGTTYCGLLTLDHLEQAWQYARSNHDGKK